MYVLFGFDIPVLYLFYRRVLLGQKSDSEYLFGNAFVFKISVLAVIKIDSGMAE